MYDTILVPTDGSETARRAAEEAFQLARTTGATVHLLFVMDESARSLLLNTESMGSRFERLREEAEQLLADLAADAGGISVQTSVGRGTQVYRGIVSYAEQEGVDLIVMGSAGRHGPGGVLGSTTQRVAEHTTVPVLVVPDPDAVAERQPSYVDPEEEAGEGGDADGDAAGEPAGAPDPDESGGGPTDGDDE